MGLVLIMRFIPGTFISYKKKRGPVYSAYDDVFNYWCRRHIKGLYGLHRFKLINCGFKGQVTAFEQGKPLPTLCYVFLKVKFF